MNTVNPLLRRRLSFRRFSATVVGLLAFTALTGCDHKPEAANEPPAEIGISYSAKSGLLLSPETSKFIGLETVEVSERPLRAIREVTAQVFQVAKGDEPHALASALVSAAEADLLHPGLTSAVTATSPAIELLRFDRSGESQTGLVEAILRVTDAAGTLKEGGLITARFPVGDTNAVTVIPNAALFHALAGDFVYLENGAHFTRAAVKPGRTDGKFTEVTDGLFPGDKVVAHAVMTLWMTELHNVNGGDACCIKLEPKK